MNCILVMETGGLQEFFPIAAGTINIGRESDNDIQLLDESVSRHHAKIFNMASACEIEDNDSANGVFINGRQAKRTILRHGDEIRLGTCIMKFEEVHYDVGEDIAAAGRDYSSKSQASTVKVKLHPTQKHVVERKETTTLSPFRLKKKGDTTGE